MYSSRASKPPKKHFGTWISVTILAIAAVYVAVILAWPLQAVEAQLSKPKNVQAKSFGFNWPSGKQSAIGAINYGELGNSPSTKQLPMASITKIVTALTVLDAKPIVSAKAKSPQITFTSTDAKKYSLYLSRLGSVAPAPVGKSISQYDMLSVMLVASANNYADSLAVWAYGSMDSYIKSANEYLQAHGLTQTTVADASGFSKNSVSTARDLVKLGELALADPVIAGIVDKPEVAIAGIGTFRSTNLIVNEPNIIGIKTGTTDIAGSCLLYAAKFRVSGKPVTVIGASLGAKTRSELAAQAQQLLVSAKNGFKPVTYAQPKQVFATYTTAWGEDVAAITYKKASVLAWSGHNQNIQITAKSLIPSKPAAKVGSVTIESGGASYSQPLYLDETLDGPSWQWRLTHPLEVLQF